MTATSEATLESPPAYPRAPAAPVACIDLDRFCDGCGYNLRTLPVHRDERTGIPIVRCTECGRYQAANDAATAVRPWLDRVMSVVLVAWMLTIASGFFWFGLGEGALSYAVLDELTLHGGYTIQRTGNSTTIIRQGRPGPLEIRPEMPDDKAFITAMLIASLATAFACGMFAVVVLPHWPRVAYVAVLMAMPIVANGIVTFAWFHEAPHLFGWGLLHVWAHAGVQLAGGLAGIWFGRPLARLTVQIFLPPVIRPKLAYLWLADAKPFPRR